MEHHDMSMRLLCHLPSAWKSDNITSVNHPCCFYTAWAESSMMASAEDSPSLPYSFDAVRCLISGDLLDNAHDLGSTFPHMLDFEEDFFFQSFWLICSTWSPTKMKPS
uniref:uncharacterized protein isoform X3 n=1 Tax=Myxine glutinosa TaxID=7769 RepID=UPI00358F0278